MVAVFCEEKHLILCFFVIKNPNNILRLNSFHYFYLSLNRKYQEGFKILFGSLVDHLKNFFLWNRFNSVNLVIKAIPADIYFWGWSFSKQYIFDVIPVIDHIYGRSLIAWAQIVLFWNILYHLPSEKLISKLIFIVIKILLLLKCVTLINHLFHKTSKQLRVIFLTSSVE